MTEVEGSHGDLSARRLGAGPRVVLVHGGLSPEATWRGQEPLAERWELVIPARRGYGDSPPAEMIDFEVDAADLEPLVGNAAHVAAFSYGGAGAAVAAVRHPEKILSLTLIEPSLFAIAAGHPAVNALGVLAERYITGTADESERDRFLSISGVPAGDDAARDFVEAQVGRIRDPGEADPDLSVLRDAGVPVMVVSGDHEAAIEAVCDAVAERTGGERVVYEGAGHAAHKAPGYNERFETFLRASSGPR